MSIILRQSTQVQLPVGPFRNYLDGVSMVTGIVIAGSPAPVDQAELLKAGGAATVDISSATWAAISGVDGHYHITLTTSHTDTIGPGKLVFTDADAFIPVTVDFQVVEEAVYDAYFASSAVVLTPDVAGRLNRSGGSMSLVTVDSGSSVSSVVASAIDPASSVDDQFNGKVLIFASDTTTAALRGQAKQITDFDHSGQTFTTDAFTTAPQSSDTAVIV